MADAKTKRPAVDWEAVEREYRAGLKTLRQIADEFHVSNPAIVKRAKRDGWERDLSAKIHAKAELLVSKQLVSKEVSKEAANSDRITIDATAKVIADVVLGQRENVQRLTDTVIKLWAEIDAIGDYGEEFHKLGEALRKEDDFGNDKLNDAYQYVIGMPQRVKSIKLLADALKVLIELQRKVLRIDEKPDAPPGGSGALTDAQRASRIATLLAKAGA